MRALSSLQFATWSERLRRSDSSAFADLYQQTYDSLHRYVWYYTRDADACADVLQDLYLKLWQMRTRLDPSRSLKALLYQMARNFALNHLRSRQRHDHNGLDGLPAEPAVGATAEHDLDGEKLGTRLAGWIASLPPRQREAFCLSRYEGLSHDEIAAVMELAPKTVNNHIVLALQSLRQHLHHYDADLLHA